ncbi:MAG: SiaB family protein kinase [Flavobacteriales bacterium]
MTAITGQHLDWIQSQYQNLLSSVLHSGGNEVIVFSHFGDFTPSKIEHTLKLIESSIIELGDKRQMMKRFTGLLLELLQNIALHSARDKSGHMHSYLVVSRSAELYRLMTGNLIMMDDLTFLNDRLTELNHMDKNSLRKLYIETLCNDEFSYKGGAGLGLLTVAKRADHKLDYHLDKMDDSFGYFRLEASLNIEE